MNKLLLSPLFLRGLQLVDYNKFITDIQVRQVLRIEDSVIIVYVQVLQCDFR